MTDVPFSSYVLFSFGLLGRYGIVRNPEPNLGTSACNSESHVPYCSVY